MLGKAETKRVDDFARLIEAAFSKKVGRIVDQTTFTKTNGNLLKSEYNSLRQVVFQSKTSEFLWELMKAYLNTYGGHRDNPNLIHYYKSDQLYLFLLEQSAKVSDDALFETWAGFVENKQKVDYNSFQKRYADLDVNWQTQIAAFFAGEREKRRARRSLLDLLRDEYVTVKKAKPTIKDLYDFDPRPTSRTVIDLELTKVVDRWLDACNDGKEEKLKAFAASLEAVRDYFKQLGNEDPLRLFQAIKMVQLSPDVPELSSDRSTLYRGLYAIACIQLHGAALRAKLYVKNRIGFTPEEIDYFAFSGRLARSAIPYRSNIVAAITEDISRPAGPIGAVEALLSTFLLAKAKLPQLTLAARDDATMIQAKWVLLRAISRELAIPIKRGDAAKIQEVMTDPANADGVGAMREMGSNRVTLTDGHVLGTGDYAAGTKLGQYGGLGEMSVAYIRPTDGRIYVEFSGLKLQFFIAPRPWLADRRYAAALTEIHRSTIGIVELNNLIFAAMGFLPVLIEAGIAGVAYEIGVMLVSSKIEEELAKIDPGLAKIVALAIGLFAPRPHFGPKLNVDVVEQADRSLLSDRLNVKPADRGITDRAIGADERGTGQLSAAEVDDLLGSVPVVDELVEMNSGLPLTRSQLTKALEPFRAGYSRVPNEWKTVVAECAPLRKLIEAVQKDPNGEIKLVKISAKQGETLPFKYQKSSMGSDHELHVTLDGHDYRLDGIVKRPDGEWYIGESKFTFKDMMDEPMANLLTKGKQNPTTSWHYVNYDKAVAQFERYADVAKRFGFKGVAVYTNTDFVWATFEQTTRHIDNIELVVSRLDEELSEFSRRTAKSSTAKTRAAARPKK